MNTERKWQGKWINSGLCMGNPSNTVPPAPYLRKTFEYTTKPAQAIIYLCGLGFHELYVNNQKVDNRVLAPTVSQYDKHVNYIEYDVTNLIKVGKNAVVVLLGNGLYNSRVPHWNFDKAPWRDYAKMLCDIEIDGQIIAKSDNSWLVANSPITFNEYRNGQHYDARLEIPNFSDSSLDDSSWKKATYCMPPGGRVILDTQEPCQVMQSYPAISHKFVTCWESTYDFGVNLSGWCKIKVKGPAGAEIKLTYAEKIDPISGLINNLEINPYENFGEFQTDVYILKGNPEGEVFEPSFAYHGFRYVQFWSLGNVEVIDIVAQFVHTSFDNNGYFNSSDATLNTLQRNTLQSYKSNYVGIPTDCPHREKNGWTGDAAIAAETGIWNFNMEKGYTHFTRVLVDTQRVNGQLPGIAPSPGWGYNWGSGPAWDNLLFEYPYLVYKFYGNSSLIEEYYENFKLYLEYCESRAEDYLLNFGLGDWCCPNRLKSTPIIVTSTGYYYQNVLRMALFADILGNKNDKIIYQNLATQIKNSFLKTFANEDNTFADKSLTATAAALYFKIITGKEAQASAQALVNLVRQAQHKANFGILGAKMIPRVLSDYNYIDDAFEIFTQKEFPGWAWQLAHNATTLWENWNGKDSQNHIMFGDVSAWMYQYLAGIHPLEESPGFIKFNLKPQFPQKLNNISVSYQSKNGLITSAWERVDNQIKCSFNIPQSSSANIILPNKTVTNVSGKFEIII